MAIAKVLSRVRPVSLAFHTRDQKESRKLTLAEKVHMIHGAPAWKTASEDLRDHWRKLAAGMAQGVTDIFRGRKAGVAGISMAKVPGKSIQQQAANPNKPVGRSVIRAPKVVAPKAPSIAQSAG